MNSEKELKIDRTILFVYISRKRTMALQIKTLYLKRRPVCFEMPEYSAHISFETLDKDILRAIRVRNEIHLIKKLQISSMYGNNTIHEIRDEIKDHPFLVVRILAKALHGLRIDVNIIAEFTWDGLKSMCITHIQALAQFPSELTDVAFSNVPCWNPEGNARLVLDTENCKTPFETFKDGSIVYITMVRRKKKKSHLWYPTHYSAADCNWNLPEEVVSRKLEKMATTKHKHHMVFNKGPKYSTIVDCPSDRERLSSQAMTNTHS